MKNQFAWSPRNPGVQDDSMTYLKDVMALVEERNHLDNQLTRLNKMRGRDENGGAKCYQITLRSEYGAAVDISLNNRDSTDDVIEHLIERAIEVMGKRYEDLTKKLARVDDAIESVLEPPRHSTEQTIEEPEFETCEDCEEPTVDEEEVLPEPEDGNDGCVADE